MAAIGSWRKNLYHKLQERNYLERDQFKTIIESREKKFFFINCLNSEAIAKHLCF